MKIMVLVALLSFSPLIAQSDDIHPTVLSAAGGRYVFGQVNSLRADQYLLDTKTGRMWQITLDSEKRPVLQEIPFSFLEDGKEVFSIEPRKVTDSK